MSANLNLQFIIKEFNPEKGKELCSNLKSFLEMEYLYQDGDMEVDIMGNDENIHINGYTTRPISISGFGRWLDDIEPRFKSLADRINGAPCKATLNVEDVDN